MKQLFYFLLIISLPILLQSCTEEDVPNFEKVHFTLKTSDIDNSARSKALPDSVHLQLTIQTDAGEAVLTDYTTPLLVLNNSYVINPIELRPGKYKIVKFLLVKGSTIVYATPYKGSPLAGTVVNPLDVTFQVVSNEATNLEMEVLDATEHEANDFGYASLQIGLVNTFDISVFAGETESVDFTSAEAYVLQGTDTVRTYAITPEINRIAFAGDPEKTYSLDIVKDGYQRYSRQFNISVLEDELNNKPLNVLLEPAFTLRFQSKGKGIDNQFKMNLNGLPGSTISINWGDGTSSSHTFSAMSVGGQSHTYAKEGNHFISVSGDLGAITYFSAVYNKERIERINLENLSELKSLVMGYQGSPTTLDLTQNKKIELLSLSQLVELKQIDLPEEHFLNDVYITGSTAVTTNVMNKFIENIYDNAIGKQIADGAFVFETAYNTGIMIGSPSAQSLSQLRQLREILGWYIVPNP